MSRIHIDISGAGMPLVMLHGWGWNSRIWTPLLPQLEKKYQVFLIDIPGFGNSPLLNKYFTLQNIVPELLAVTPPSAAWLGWSMGGLFALWAASHFPERVSHLITVASSPRFVSDDHWPGVATTTLDKFSDLLKNDAKKTLTDFLELQLRGSPKRHELFSQLQNTLFLNQEKPSAGLLPGLHLLRDTDLREEMTNIVCPSLHIYGQLDTIVPRQIANLLPSLLPESRNEIITHTGHMPFLSHSAEFLALLDQFLS